MQAEVTWQNIYKSAPDLAKGAAWDCGCFVSTQTLMASKGFPLPGTHQHTWTTCKTAPCTGVAPLSQHGAPRCQEPTFSSHGWGDLLLDVVMGYTGRSPGWRWWVATCLQGKHMILIHR